MRVLHVLHVLHDGNYIGKRDFGVLHECYMIHMRNRSLFKSQSSMRINNYMKITMVEVEIFIISERYRFTKVFSCFKHVTHM